MVDNQQFILRTNFLKNEKNISFVNQSAKLRVERHVFDSWRTNRVAVPEHIEKRLIAEFPELTEFENLVSEPPAEIVYEKTTYNHELIETQRHLIKLMKEELERQKMENQRLRDRIEEIRKSKGK